MSSAPPTIKQPWHSVDVGAIRERSRFVLSVGSFPRRGLRCVGRRRARGFTLVEVAMALGIVSFAFVALLGVLPVGLKSYRESMEATLRANIVRKVVANIEQSWGSEGLPTERRIDWFDDQGTLVGGQSGAIFRVETSAAGAMDLFGASQTSVRRVVVEIFDARQGARISSFPVVLPALGS